MGRLLSDAELVTIKARASKAVRAVPNTAEALSCMWDIPVLLSHIAALQEQLDIARRNSEQVAMLTEKVTAAEKLIHDYQDKELE